MSLPNPGTFNKFNNANTSSNKDLTLAMDCIQEDFEYTKKIILKASEQLDKLELTYNTILKEYQKRMKPNGDN